MNIAVILAGGLGNRMGLEKPKQFLKIAGKTVIEHTVEVFQKNNNIDEIAIVVHHNFIYLIEDMVLKNKWNKVKKILAGGAERYESSLVAINAYSDKDENSINLIFHDAVRPLVSKRIIDDTISALQNYDAVDVAIPSSDTIIKLIKGQKIIDIIPERHLFNKGQTPQAFTLKTIRNAYNIALSDPDFTVTDDCGVVVKYLPNVPVYVVEGEQTNIKLTYPEDIYLLDKLFQLKTSCVDASISLDRLENKVLVVFGGNSGIGKDIVNIANSYNAHAYPFSRSLNNTDVTDIDSIRREFDLIEKKEGHIDFVVNSAAILNKEPLIHLSAKTISDIVNINYLGVVNTSVASYEYLKNTQGQLLHFTSSSYTRGRAFYCMYSSTKCAVVNFVQALAEEWAPNNIRVNCINPQRTKTPMRTANFGIEPENTLLKSTEVAEVSLKTLLSDFTGQVVDVKKQ